jgi:hypothetical protein
MLWTLKWPDYLLQAETVFHGNNMASLTAWLGGLLQMTAYTHEAADTRYLPTGG